MRTGKLTMLYMALSLAFTAGGIILLYLLWQATPVEGQTLNAVVFGSIIGSLGLATRGQSERRCCSCWPSRRDCCSSRPTPAFSAGPAVLSNMAADSWVPHKFRYLSTRLVTQNGIVHHGAGGAAHTATGPAARYDLLVVLYSISVFLTFSVSLLGLCIYWWRKRSPTRAGLRALVLSRLGLAVTVPVILVDADGGKIRPRAGGSTVVDHRA